MGCDIHMYVEKKIDGKWQFLPPPERELWKNQDGTSYMGADWYWGRNYSLFAMLADVRNGYGFAGVDRGEKVAPIDFPRGVPSDASPEYLEIVEEWGIDGHSHQYFTLAELEVVDWMGESITHRGWVGPTEFARFKRDGKPLTWSGGVSGGNVKHVSNEGMQALIDAGTVTPDLSDEDTFWENNPSSYYTQVEWTEPWAATLGAEWFDFLDRLRELSEGDAESVRAVFFFDN